MFSLVSRKFLAMRDIALCSVPLVYLFFFVGIGSCLEKNTDLFGNDITPVTQRLTNSWQECGNYFLK